MLKSDFFKNSETILGSPKEYTGETIPIKSVSHFKLLLLTASAIEISELQPIFSAIFLALYNEFPVPVNNK